MKKRIMVFVLVFCALLGFVAPLASDAGAQKFMVQANAQTALLNESSTTLLGTAGMARGQETNYWSGSYVYFGKYNGNPIRFRVLQSSTTAFSGDEGNATMLLDCDTLLLSAKFDDSSNDWRDSWLRRYLNGDFLIESVSEYEREVIAHSKKNAPTEEEEQLGNSYGEFVSLDDDVFLLDVREVLTDENSCYGNHRLLRKNFESDIWWLRTKGSNFDNITYWVQVIDPDRAFNFSNHKPKPSEEYGVSPAMNIDLSRVLFANLVSGELGQSEAEYALTIINEEQFCVGLDDDAFYAYQQNEQSVERDGNRLKIPYQVLTDGSKASLQLLLLDKPYEECNANGARILLKESLGEVTNGEKGSTYYDLPDEFSKLLCGKDYYAYLIVEQDGDNAKQTVCASKPYEVTIPALTRLANLGTRAFFINADGWTKANGTKVYFGEFDRGDGAKPCLFRVLPSSPETMETSPDSILLDSDDVLTSMKFHDSSTNWDESAIKQWLEETVVPGFSEVEQGAILPTTLRKKPEYYWTDYFRDDKSENNRMFLLSIDEISRLYRCYKDLAKGEEGRASWSLRSVTVYTLDPATACTYMLAAVGEGGMFTPKGLRDIHGVAPAFHLDTSKILLTTTGRLDKSQSITADSRILASNGQNDSWRLTLLDERKTVGLAEGCFAGADNGKIYVPYSYADSAASDAEKVNQISVMITDYPYTDSRAQIMHYGALQDITDENGLPSSASDAKTGIGSFCLPDGLAGRKLGTDYYIYLIAEHTENNDKTDYASAPAEVAYICSTGGAGSYVPPMGKDGLTYTGKIQELVSEDVVTPGAAFRYSLDGKGWSKQAIAVNAGKHRVYWKLIDSVTGEDLYLSAAPVEVMIALLTVTNPDGGNSYHVNLPAAMAKAKDGAVIKLHGDVIDDTMDLSYDFSGNRNVTIDLNGQTLRCKRTLKTKMSSLKFIGDGTVDTSIDFNGGNFYCEGGIFLKRVALYQGTSGGQISGGYFVSLSSTFMDLRTLLADGHEYFRDGSVYHFSQKNVAEEVYVASATSGGMVMVTYLQNGGTGSMDALEINPGKTFTVAGCEFVRDGYVFSGWNTEADGSGKSYVPGKAVMVDRDTTLYAQWVPKQEYTVTFDANGGEGQMEPQTFYEEEAQKLNASNFTRRKYLFDGWNTSPDGGGAAVSNGQLLILDCDITLYAQWKTDPDPIYLVTIRSSAGGTASAFPKSGKKGQKITLTATPEDGYYLKEWKFISDELWINKNDPYFFIPTDDVVIEAVFAEIPENQSVIRFDANGGTGRIADTLVEKGTEFTLPENCFENGDRIFTGWNTERDGSGTGYADGQTITTDKGLTLYAQWREIYTFSVRFDANGGTGTMPEQSFTEGRKDVLKTNTFVRNGYTFAGWNTKADGSGTNYIDGKETTVSENIVLYAVWLDNSVGHYRVTVSVSCDAAASADVSIGTTGTLVHLTAEERAVRYDYVEGVPVAAVPLRFSRWEVISGDVAVIDGSFVIGTSDVHVRACYESFGAVSHYTITYNTNCGSYTWENSQVAFNGSAEVQECWGWNPGYAFTGWNTKADGSGMTVTPGQEIKIYGDLTLYAQWNCEHRGGTATCTEQATCSNCGKKYGDFSHSYSEDWSADEAKHWHQCSKCGGKAEEASHDDSNNDDLCDVCGRTFVAGYYRVTVSASCNGAAASADVSVGTTGTLVHLTAKKQVTDFEQAAPTPLWFSHWEVISGDVAVIDDSFVIGTSDVHVRACYITDPVGVSYQITYHTNCGSSSLVYSGGMSLGSVSVSECRGSNPGYVFTGWNTKADGSGMTVTPGQRIKISGDLTLYAQWECEHRGGGATCTEQGTCVVCGKKYGGSSHSYQETWSSNETKHWHECTACGDRKDESEHVPGPEATETEPQLCTECGYLLQAPQAHTHRFTVENTAAAYLKSPATCISGAEYYYSCLCGEKGTDTFLHGDVIAHDDADHDHACDTCKSIISEHTGGTATCKEKAICEICKESYGELGEHSFTIKNPKTRYRKSSASCTSKAVYYYSCVCGKKGTETFEYGGVLSHTDEDGNHRCDFCGVRLSYCSDWNDDHLCDVCDALLSYCTDRNNDHACDLCGKILGGHTGGTATCTERAICEICGESYGELAEHSYLPEWSMGDAGHWHECTACGAKAEEAAHADADKNHACDLCGRILNACADTDNDHACDLCGTMLSECADTDHDHACDLCGKLLGGHTGGTPTCTEKAICEICGESYGELAEHSYLPEWSIGDAGHWHACAACGAKAEEAEHTDADKNHACDLCGTMLSECADTENDHVCDLCGTILSECADTENDHVCDLCGTILSECSDADHDHACDLCGKLLGGHIGGTATCTEKAICEICGESYGELAEHSYLSEWSKGDTDHWHACAVCGARAEEAEHADADRNHVCDFCGKTFSACADQDNDHACDLCGKILSAHTGGTPTDAEETPQAGDDFNPVVPVVCLTLGGGAAAGATVYRRRKRRSVK